MIKSFKHKGLKLFFEEGVYSGIQAKHKKKLRMQLIALDTAKYIEDMDLPGYNLHPLKGQRQNVWSIKCKWKLAYYFYF